MRAAIICLLVLACGSDPAAPSADAAGFDGPMPPQERSCATVFAYRPAAGVTDVALAGEWDWSVREPMKDPDGDGVYSIEKMLPPGFHAYKLVVDGQWLLDPSAPYRKYSGGIENSAVRVDDCRVPLLSRRSFQATAAGLHAELEVLRGAGGATAHQVTATLSHDFAEMPLHVDFDMRIATVRTGALSPGKYTLRVSAQGAQTLLLPFWVETEPFDWRDATIYMVMVDRFNNGNPGNDGSPTLGAEPQADWHGGDLSGITQALQAGTLDGIRALWLSPLNRNPPGYHLDQGHGVSGYHGYWPVRAREIDPHFGTDADLEALVRAAHARGIRVLLDYVINHVHAQHDYFAQHPDWFRTGCQCGTAGCDWTAHRLDCMFNPYMPDVNWQEPDGAEQFIADARWWLERFDLDGLRIDAVKHVEDAAIFDLSTRIHEELETAGTEYFLLGETAMGWAGHDITANRNEYDTISRYIGPWALNGQFDFVLYHAAAYRVFAYDEYSMPHLDYWTRASLSQYPSYAIMTPYLGSHDTERFVSLAAHDPNAHHKWASDGLPSQPTTDEPYARMRVALAWLFGIPGAPLLYYGDEYGEYGGGDPDNRHVWRPSSARTSREQSLAAFTTKVLSARKQLAPLRRGDYRTLAVTEPFLAFARTYNGEAVVVTLNHGAQPQTMTIRLPDDVTMPASLRDILGSEVVPVQNRSFTITLPGRSAAYWAR